MHREEAVVLVSVEDALAFGVGELGADKGAPRNRPMQKKMKAEIPVENADLLWLDGGDPVQDLIVLR